MSDKIEPSNPEGYKEFGKAITRLSPEELAAIVATEDQNLEEFLKKNPPADFFIPYCHLDEQANVLTIYFKEDADFSEQLSDNLIIYRSLKTREIVGGRIASKDEESFITFADKFVDAYPKSFNKLSMFSNRELIDELNKRME